MVSKHRFFDFTFYGKNNCGCLNLSLILYYLYHLLFWYSYISGQIGLVSMNTKNLKDIHNNLRDFRKSFKKSEEKYIQEMRNHKINGTLGYWCVSGFRHKAIVKTDRADTAIELAKNIVQDWEMPTV